MVRSKVTVIVILQQLIVMDNKYLYIVLNSILNGQVRGEIEYQQVRTPMLLANGGPLRFCTGKK